MKRKTNEEIATQQLTRRTANAFRIAAEDRATHKLRRDLAAGRDPRAPVLLELPALRADASAEEKATHRLRVRASRAHLLPAESKLSDDERARLQRAARRVVTEYARLDQRERDLMIDEIIRIDRRDSESDLAPRDDAFVATLFLGALNREAKIRSDQ